MSKDQAKLDFSCQEKGEAEIFKKCKNLVAFLVFFLCCTPNQTRVNGISVQLFIQ